MLAFLFAVVSLTNIDPEAIVTPAPLVRGTTNAGSGFAPGDGSLPAGLGADIEVAPVCTFGMPRFGTDLWSDASALSRTLAPQCAGMTSPFAYPGYGASGFSPFGSSPFSFGLPWLGATTSVVRLAEPVGLSKTINEPTIVRFPPTQAIRAIPQPVLEARPAESALSGARAVTSVKTPHSH